ncbi:MAG TPA: PRC-barrel domain-containing protein [Alphaproteobacteria bacterium]|nr:PRC-barrel domain-containing protein [Alphaproteobacteria bacterium]
MGRPRPHGSERISRKAWRGGLVIGILIGGLLAGGASLAAEDNPQGSPPATSTQSPAQPAAPTEAAPPAQAPAQAAPPTQAAPSTPAPAQAVPPAQPTQATPPAPAQATPPSAAPPKQQPTPPAQQAPTATPGGKTKDGTPTTVLSKDNIQGVLGKDVKSETGQDMGRIVNVIVDRAGKPRAAVIDFGGFLGVGSRKIAVDWNALHFAPDGKTDQVTLDLTRDQVKAAPEYKEGKPVVVLGASGSTQTVPENDLR